MTATDHNFSKTLFNDSERLTILYCTLIKKICKVTLKIVIKRIFGAKKTSLTYLCNVDNSMEIYTTSM